MARARPISGSNRDRWKALASHRPDLAMGVGIRVPRLGGRPNDPHPLRPED
jgi:hypothetical protein